MLRRTLTSILVPVALLLLVIAAPAVVGAGGGCHVSDGSVYTEGTATVVRMGTCSFAPTVARVPVGTELRFLNTADIDHMVLGRSGTWGSQMLQPGTEYSETFTSAGTYPFECPLHPGMVGAIVVGGSADVAGPAAISAGSGPTATPTAAASSVETGTDAGRDWGPIAIAAAAGLAAGAIGGGLVASVAARRRSQGSATD